MGKWNFDVMWLWRVLLLYATACTIVLSGCVLGLNEEGQLLLKWKQDLLEDPDNTLSNWNVSDPTPCFWNGVKCTQGSVSGLDFSPSPFESLGGDINALTFSKLANLTTLNVANSSFAGNFPRDIVNCSKLMYLNLSWTYITGEVPANLINLHKLQVLDLTYASMEGTVVTRFDELQELRVLRLANNFFEGQMPQSIPSLKKLEELTLSLNNWNGTLHVAFFMIPSLKVLWLGSNLDVQDMVPWPEDFSLWDSMEDLRLQGVNFPPSLIPTGILKMTKLRTLQLERCNIMGPIPSLQNLTHLEYLNLANNTLSGNIPDMFGSMANLTILWLYDNLLTGPFPTSLWQCRRLRSIIAFSNGLSGDLEGVANLSNSLEWFDLAINNFSGEIPSSFGNLTLLRGLHLYSNSFNGELPYSLGNLSLLVELDLQFNNLIGKIPPKIADWEGLVELMLRNNNLTGEIPYNLGRNAVLQNVDLGNNLLEGPVPPYLCWGNNVTLQLLRLDGNKFTGRIPETYGNCTNLVVVRLDGNQLEGPVPAGLWGGANLVRMQLNGNNLSGSIGVNIGEATSLSILYLQDNIFGGPIPVEIGRTSLVKFHADSNKLNGTLTPLLGNLSSLTELNLGANSFNGTIPPSLGNCTSLVQLDLSKNYLEGAIPNELANLNKLSTLDLSENHLSGAIPKSLFNVLTLQTLNVAFNNLSGVIPKQGNGQIFVNVNFTGNPYLCEEGSCVVEDIASVGGRRQAWIVVVGVVGAVTVVLFVVSVLVLRRHKSDLHELSHYNEDESSWTLTSFDNKVYHEDEVTALDEDNLIGVGGSGKVYKVTLSDGEMVAVKKLWNVKQDKGSHDHGFGTELKTLTNIRHRHIVKLFCCCSKRDINLLVYEYMPKGSLGDLLHGPKAETLPWDIRYKIAVGAATGLEYLHHDCSPQILHRDIKSNNILVDLEYEAHLADFGISRMVESASSYDLSSVAGSLGYIPPEYLFGTQVTEKIDIYSFGVVLLELVTGKRATGPLECVEGTSLVQWVHNSVVTPEGLCEILDSKCVANSQNEMVQLLKIAISCTNYIPASRPSMREVVKLLGDTPPKPSLKIDTNKDGGGEETFHDFDVFV